MPSRKDCQLVFRLASAFPVASRTLYEIADGRGKPGLEIFLRNKILEGDDAAAIGHERDRPRPRGQRIMSLLEKLRIGGCLHRQVGLVLT